MSALDESTTELAALELFVALDYQNAHGPDIVSAGSAQLSGELRIPDAEQLVEEAT